jgi:hypothetical protein
VNGADAATESMARLLPTTVPGEAELQLPETNLGRP